MDEDTKAFLESLIHGPCAGITYKQFVDFCEKRSRELLSAAQLPRETDSANTWRFCPNCGYDLNNKLYRYS